MTKDQDHMNENKPPASTSYIVCMPHLSKLCSVFMYEDLHIFLYMNQIHTLYLDRYTPVIFVHMWPPFINTVDSQQTRFVEQVYSMPSNAILCNVIENKTTYRHILLRIQSVLEVATVPNMNYNLKRKLKHIKGTCV